MAAVPAFLGSSNLPFDIARLLMIGALIPAYRTLAGKKDASGSSVVIRPVISEAVYYAGFLVVVVLARAWHGLVTRHAPEPYLVSF